MDSGLFRAAIVFEVILLSAGTLDLCGTALAAEPRPLQTALDEYVAQVDPHYSWSIAKVIHGKGVTTYLVDMKSQAWRTPEEVDRTVWHHWLTVVKPDRVAFDTAFLLIGGGSNTSPSPKKPDKPTVAITMG